MQVELKIPSVGESIQEVQIGRWLKQPGDRVEADENIVELETDKASMELPAPATGVLEKVVKRQGEVAAVGDIIAYVASAEPPSGKSAEVPAEANSGAGRSETPAAQPHERTASETPA
ncbi:MAG: biotin/lipoyl-containing protein, partial [Pirellulaceae bacterium]